MKAALFICLFMVAVLAAAPASAQLVLYDDFEAKTLDPVKWSGEDSGDTGVDTLEAGRLVMVDPIFGLKWLDIYSRSYASQASDTGRSSAHNRLLFDNGSSITAIQATVMVRKIKATTCSSNTAATNSQARIGGMFFNTGTATAGNATNDVRAFITIGRASNSNSPSNVLDITGAVVLCTNSNCSENTPIGTVDVGKAFVNLPVKVRITWDSLGNRFVFQKGKAAEVQVVNTENVGGAPGSGSGDGNKRIEVNHQIPNCTIARPMAYMDAYFDNIKIEQIP